MQTIDQIYKRIEDGEGINAIVKDFEMEILDYALIKNYGSISRTAKALKMARLKVYKLLEMKKCKN